MPLVNSDETLERAGLDSREALIEFACHLFDVGKLALWLAAQFAEMSRAEFEAQLFERKIPIYRPTLKDFETDLATLEFLRSQD